MRREFGLFALLSTACRVSYIQQDFDSARLQALADPGQPRSDWKADSSVYLAQGRVTALVEQMLEHENALEASFKVTGMSFSTRLEVADLTLTESDRCRSCFGVQANLEGEVTWRALGTAGTVPMTAEALFDAQFLMNKRPQGWDVNINVRDMREVTFDIPRTTQDVRLRTTQQFATWLGDDVIDKIKPVTLFHVGSLNAPVRAVRMVPEAPGVRFDVLTSSPESTDVVHGGVRPDRGAEIRVSQTTLLGLARAAAFRHGEVAPGFHLEPVELEVDGDEFYLELRIWNLKGSGWYREYMVFGDVIIDNRGVHLSPSHVEASDVGSDSGTLDVLSWLAGGAIMRAIEDGMSTSLPSEAAVTTDAVTARIRIRSLARENDDLKIGADLRLKKSD